MSLKKHKMLIKNSNISGGFDNTPKKDFVNFRYLPDEDIF